MNQDLVMMFNDVEGTKLTSEVQEVSADGMIAALYKELQHNIAGQTMEVVPEDITYKGMDCTVLTPGGMPLSINTIASTSDNNSSLKFVSEGSICSSLVEDPSNCRVKTIDIPDTWNIALLESNSLQPHDAGEHETEKQGYQLWECPTCTALFREKEVCEQHVNKSHDFTCGLCYQPFQEKEALENHIISHILEVPGSVLQKPVLKGESSKSEDISTGHNCNVSVTDEVFNCPDCDFSFPSILDLEKHKTCHFDGHHVDCSSVKVPDELYFPTKVIHSFEVTQKSSGSKFTCDVCHQMFFTRNSLLLHMTKKHQASPMNRNYFCTECGANFKWKLSLQNHQIVDHGKRK